VDAELAGVPVQQRGEVGRPRPRHRRAADAVLQQDVARRHERHEVAELHAQIRERSACMQFIVNNEHTHDYLRFSNRSEFIIAICLFALV